jgi:DNA modification methylase
MQSLGIYKLPDVICGDAFKLLDTVPDESVQLLITDPPYNISRVNNFDTMGREGFNWIWDKEFDVTGWIKNGSRTLSKGGSLIVFTDWKLLGTLTAAATAAKLDIKDPIVFEKANPIPRNVTRRYVSDKEFAFWAVKPGAKWTFNLPDDEHYLRSTFHYAIPRKRVHPTKKPVGLFAELMEIHSNPGDVVMDPFCGEGTTGVAAERTGRLSLQMELDKDMADYATKALVKSRP